MNDSFGVELLRTVLPAVTLMATSLVTIFIAVIKSKLDENTRITQATQTALTTSATDASSGFKDMGQWRYKVDERFARLEADVTQKLAHIEQRLAEADTHRVIRESVASAAATAPVPAPAPLPAPSPAAPSSPQVAVIEVNQP